jgi:hypothetical protein
MSEFALISWCNYVFIAKSRNTACRNVKRRFVEFQLAKVSYCRIPSCQLVLDSPPQALAYCQGYIDGIQQFVAFVYLHT